MKLSSLTIIAIGIFVFIWCLLLGWVNWSPNERETTARKANTEAANAEADKQGQAKKRRDKAVAEVNEEAANWRAITATKTPSSSLSQGGIDISENGAQLIVDSRVFRDSIQKAVNKQLKIGGVKLVGSGPTIAMPGEAPSTILADYYNYPSIPFPVVIFDLGTITVTGTYEQIMANVRAWSQMPNYLAVADGLRIEGTSPNLTGAYAVSIVGYIHGKKVFTSIPETPGASSGAAGGAAGGGRGGFGGGRGGFGGSAGGPPGVPGGTGPGTGGRRGPGIAPATPSGGASAAG